MEPVGFWQWVGLILVFCIPIVNFIVMIVGACGVGKPSFVNYCRALSLWLVVGIVAVLIYGFLTGAI